MKTSPTFSNLRFLWSCIVGVSHLRCIPIDLNAILYPGVNISKEELFLQVLGIWFMMSLKILLKVTENHKSSFFPYKQVSGRNGDHEWFRMNNAFMLCDLVWKVQKSHAAYREGSFNNRNNSCMADQRPKYQYSPSFLIWLIPFFIVLRSCWPLWFTEVHMINTVRFNLKNCPKIHQIVSLTLSNIN